MKIVYFQIFFAFFEQNKAHIKNFLFLINLFLFFFVIVSIEDFIYNDIQENIIWSNFALVWQKFEQLPAAILFFFFFFLDDEAQSFKCTVAYEGVTPKCALKITKIYQRLTYEKRRGFLLFSKVLNTPMQRFSPYATAYTFKLDILNQNEKNSLFMNERQILFLLLNSYNFG